MDAQKKLAQFMDEHARETQLAIIEKCKELGYPPSMAVHLIGGLGHVLVTGATKLGWDGAGAAAANLVSSLEIRPAPESPEN